MKIHNKFSTDRWVNLSLLMVSIFLISCSDFENIVIENNNLVLEINAEMQTRISSKRSGVKSWMNKFQASEVLSLRKSTADKFSIQSVEQNQLLGDVEGSQWVVIGLYQMDKVKIEKKLTLTVYESSQNLIAMKVVYKNLSDQDLYLREWKNHHYTLLSQQDKPAFWAFQGSSSDERGDWIQPIEAGFYKKNFMGMNNSDYGGGIPVTSIWRKDAGIAVGHLELKPKLVSLPTERALGESDVEISVTKFFDYPTRFVAGEEIETMETFVMAYQGDYYNSLKNYSELMQSKGISFPAPEPEAFESVWCAWGYEREFEINEIIGTLPKVKEMGIKWVVLDDGFQIAEGDWDANPKKFPRGNIEIKELVDQIHQYGMKAKIWWTPLAADPGSQALKERPEMRLFLEDWNPQSITWWDAYYLSPVNDFAIEHTKETLDLFLNEWGFDGLKMDGQHMNAVPPDYNPASKLEYPEQASENLPGFFKMIYDYTRDVNPHAVVENCPCGTCMSYFNLTAMNQAVSSDPESSWQIRHKGKTYKALVPTMAYYGDHVELSDNASDFASSFGIGAVLGTKFTWPKDNPKASESFLLTPEKEKTWKKWFGLYDEKMLSKEVYLGDLYDIGYDKPETHVIRKGKSLYYACYADDWKGLLEFRGLEEGKYRVYDYVNSIELGKVSKDQPTLNVQFSDYLLVEVSPL